MKLKRVFISLFFALIAVGITGFASYRMAAESGIGKIIEGGFVFTKPVFIIAAAITAALLMPAAAASVYRHELKNTLILWLLIFVFSALWCAMFFVWELELTALAISAASAGVLSAICLIFINKTRELWLLLIIPLAFYICVFLSNYAVVLIN